MYFKQWDIPIESKDGTVSDTLPFVLPVLTIDEANDLLNTTSSWDSEVLAKGSDGIITDSFKLLINDYGLSSYTAPFVRTPLNNYSREWESLILSALPNIYDKSDMFLTMPITRTPSTTYSYRDFYATIEGVKRFNTIEMMVQASDLYRPLIPYWAFATNNSSSELGIYYGSGTGDSSASAMYWYMMFYWLVDGANYVIALRADGYYDYTPNYLTTSGAFKLDGSSSGSDAYRYKYTNLWFVNNTTGKKVDPLVNNDPYAKGGDTDSGGGTGDFDGSSDAIGIPDLPSASATDAGFITLFNPTLSQMQSLASYMWSDLFDLDAWRKIFADPMDAILGLSIVPVKVGSSGTREVKVGNISTGVTMDVASSQYVKVDCGTLNVKEYWGAYLDYEPFTKAEIYLPYIGTHPIAVDDIMGKAVHVEYHVDILSGACVAYVQCTGGKLDSVLYNFVGQCSSSIPITGNDWTNVVNGVLSIAGSIGTMVATGGAAVPFAVGEIASSAVNSMKPTVEKSGSVSGTGGLMGIQKPYLILTRPRQAVPKNQYKYTGYPAYINRKLSDLKGYTEVDQIHIEGVYATEQEYSELDSLIRSGVIF